MSAMQKREPRIKNAGFTLMELIVVIIILGVMAVGIGGFIKLSTQTYLNVTERDELLANARFSVERLNREIRNAVPNSIREKRNGAMHCLEFVPILTSTVYTEIPVAPEPAVSTLNIIPFQLTIDADDDAVIIVYPLNNADVYEDHSDNTGKAFKIESYPAAGAEIELTQNVIFAEDSPTQRAYIFNSPISYCLSENELRRYSGDNLNALQQLPPFLQGSSSLMAKQINFSNSSFTIEEPSLQRNAVVQINLTFSRDGEQVTFDNAVHINNIP